MSTKNKVKCISNEVWPDYLTVDKEYEIRCDSGRRYLLVADDLGNSFHYSKTYFEEL